jgi:hypothetical protein
MMKFCFIALKTHEEHLSHILSKKKWLKEHKIKHLNVHLVVNIIKEKYWQIFLMDLENFLIAVIRYQLRLIL